MMNFNLLVVLTWLGDCIICSFWLEQVIVVRFSLLATHCVAWCLEVRQIAIVDATDGCNVFRFQINFLCHFTSSRMVVNISLVETHGRVVRTFGSASKDPRFESWSYSITLSHMVSTAAPLVYQMPSGVWIACDSCTYKTPWDHSKRVGESPWSSASNSGRSRNHWASRMPNCSESRGISPVPASNSGQSQNHWALWMPNCSESRGISPDPGFQFWLKSESLGLEDAQLQWE
jgi:hypothetical protein